MEKPLYLLALMPPMPLALQIRSVQETFAHRYECRAALKNPVHITLIPPFRAAATGESDWVSGLEIWASGQAPFKLELRDFKTFPRNRVVYISVQLQPELSVFRAGLQSCMEALLPQQSFQVQDPYRPHITIAYRDLSSAHFTNAASAYRDQPFAAAFLADRLFTWKHNGHVWEVWRELPLCQAPPTGQLATG